ncbi:MAG: hypothetical protein KDK45_23395, partial [Leptospiraceae bacterium]|nr:hypothetical protein [Leptospiraceae bacterium]
CSVLSDCIAKLQSFSIPVNRESDLPDLVNALSTIFNELIENAIKFSSSLDDTIEVRIYSSATYIRIHVKNTLSEEKLENFKKTFGEIIQNPSSVEEKYFSRLQKNSENVAGTSSGIGLLMLLHDFPLRMAACFHEASVEVETEVDIRTYNNYGIYS